MPRDFTPRPYQTIGQEFIAEHDRCAVWAGMGLGKTVMTLNVLESMYNLAGETQPTLVLGPLRVARDTWPDETGKWNHLQGFEVVPITGTPSERKAALRRDAPVFTINYENVPWLVKELGDRWLFRNVIADESPMLKSFRLRQGGVRAQALAQIAHTRVKRWVNLTGTPAPNGLVDLWGQTWFLDAGRRLGRTFGAFQERFFRPVRNDEGYYDWVPTDYTQDLIQKELRDICLTLDPRDWFDLHEPITRTIDIKLPPKARDLYRQMERELFIELDGQEIEAFSAAAKSGKCLQMASGFVWADRDKGIWKPIHDAKLEALESVVNEAGGMPVLCAYQWVPDRERILKAFPKAVDLATPEGMATFKAGKAPIGVAHPKSLGHGVDGLQHVTNIAVFYSNWWAREYHDQIIERIGPVRQFQAGYDRPMFKYYLEAVGTLDRQVTARHESKRSVEELLKEAMKERKR